MLHAPEQVGATIGLGVKDMGLFLDAAHGAGMETPLAEHFAADLRKASEAGLKDQDWAAGLYQLAQNARLQAR